VKLNTLLLSQVLSILQSYPLPLASACGVPEFTNYAVSFNGCLDWIFYQQQKMTCTMVSHSSNLIYIFTVHQLSIYINLSVLSYAHIGAGDRKHSIAQPKDT